MSNPPLSFPFFTFPLSLQSYQWLKEKIVSEDGRKQQAKLKELNHITEKLGCTLPQLAVGTSRCWAWKHTCSATDQHLHHQSVSLFPNLQTFLDLDHLNFHVLYIRHLWSLLLFGRLTIMRYMAPSGGQCVNFSLCLPPAWCLRNEGVSSVLLGTSNPEQLTENLGAIQVRTHT